jgi:hypothetical protein
MSTLKIRIKSDTLNHITSKANFFGVKPYGAWKETEIVRFGLGEGEALLAVFRSWSGFY